MEAPSSLDADPQPSLTPDLMAEDDIDVDLDLAADADADEDLNTDFNRLDLPDNDIPIFDDPDNYTKRELRPQGRAPQYTTWLDNDETGNYDPNLERRRMRLRLKTSPRMRPSCNYDNDATDEKERVPIERPKLKVILRITTEDGKKSFANLVSELTAQAAADYDGYKLRARNLDTCTPDEGENGTPTTGIDLTAKPFARGCWACLSLAGSSGEPQCSLLHDERHWPCQTCEEDDVDCELVTPPMRKRGCELCKRRKLACSYTYTRNHGESCAQCASVGQPCIAGPALQFIKPRMRLDRDWEIDPLPTKKKGKLPAYEDCYECIQASIPCRYKSEDDGSPCEACKSADSPCTVSEGPPPNASPPKGKKRKKVAAPESDTNEEKNKNALEDKKEGETNKQALDSVEEDVEAIERKQDLAQDQKEAPAYEYPQTIRMPNSCNPHATPVAKRQRIELKDHASNEEPSLPQNGFTHHQPSTQRTRKSRGALKKIQTAFCHPIEFNCNLEVEQDCHFCTDPILPFRGLGHVSVTVVDWQDSSPYVEVRGGHKSRGEANTKICMGCTTDRMTIMLCNRHTMVPIPDTEYTDKQIERAMREVSDRSIVREDVAYCALCATLAQYKCPDDDRGGCGLQLCEGCAFTLTNEYHSNLQHMLTSINHKPTAEARMGLRADAELLNAKRGPLMRFLRSFNVE